MHEQAGDYEITTDAQKLDVLAIHAFLTGSYWSPGVTLEVVRRSMEHSLCFGVLSPTGEQVGFARVITDRASFAYLADVYILEPHRGKGLSKRLLRTITAHADLQDLRWFLLATRDAHSLYQQFGFETMTSSSRLMERKGNGPGDVAV